MPNQPALLTSRYSRRHQVTAPTYSGAMGSSTHQSGAVLIIGLVMLLLLTLIGVTGTQMTSLEEKITGNSRDQSQAFQAAESTLLGAEAALASVNPPTIGNAGFYLTAGALPLTLYTIDSPDWMDPTKVVDYSGNMVGVYQSYLIEQFDTTTDDGVAGGDSLEVGLAPEPVSKSWYRVTARGAGGTTGAVVMLQSIYTR